MEEVSLTETENRYFSDLFLCCDVEKTGKIPMLKATELYRSANLSNDVILEIISLAGIPPTALHISRAQFYSCLKLIAAFQASMTLRQELIAATVQLPLPRFSWKDSPSGSAVEAVASSFSSTLHLNSTSNCGGGGVLPPPPPTDRKNSLPRRGSEWHADMVVHSAGVSRRNSAATHQHQSQQQQQYQLEAAANSDVPSTDSEVEQNESSCGGAVGGGTGNNSRGMHRRRGGGSPEAWSTNSDSPTPTNSVAERPWAKENMWHGLLGDEHRQLLGTEEESSDRHSSEEEPETVDLETLYQTTPEQREYYYTQFRKVQLDHNGLLSGNAARDFFEKSRIPVDELRHIWQLCDVTRDGALSLAEFTAAMHLVVLRRYHIPLPTALPTCLHPNVLYHQILLMSQTMTLQEPPEADLLHLNDDDDDENTDNTVIGPANPNISSHMAMAAAAAARAVANEKLLRMACTLPQPSRAVPPPSPPTLTIPSQSYENSPTADPMPPHLSKAAIREIKALWSTDVPSTNWTKFTESPTSNVSSPGPKPVNFDMQRTAQAVVSDPQILHPVPLRVTPVAGTIGTTASATASTAASADVLNPDSYESVTLRDASPKQANSTAAAAAQPATATATTAHNRDSLQSNDLRAIQRPQAKKLLPAKNIGALPPPPQRESSIGSVGSGGVGNTGDSIGETTAPTQPPFHGVSSSSKKDPPPLPPPRPPHRHARSSSLDLNKFKMGGGAGAPGTQQPEITAQTSFDLQTSTGFADFTNFPDGSATNVYDKIPEQQHSLPPPQTLPPTVALPPTRFTLQSNQRVSAFEVYRKPHTPRNSQSPTATAAATTASQQSVASTTTTTTTAAAAAVTDHTYAQPTQPPPPAPFGAAGAAAIAATAPPPLTTTQTIPNSDLYERRVNAISETLRHVSFRQDTTHHMADILRHLREQNQLLLRLCNDLSDELLTVQTRKQEMALKLEALAASTTDMSLGATVAAAAPLPPVAVQVTRTGSSISAPVTANITGGSGSSGVQSNV